MPEKSNPRTWLPCAHCGDPDGPVMRGRDRPYRVKGARFGIDGVLCRRCYDGFAYTRDRRKGQRHSAPPRPKTQSKTARPKRAKTKPRPTVEPTRPSTRLRDRLRARHRPKWQAILGYDSYDDLIASKG